MIFELVRSSLPIRLKFFKRTHLRPSVISGILIAENWFKLANRAKFNFHRDISTAHICLNDIWFRSNYSCPQPQRFLLKFQKVGLKIGLVFTINAEKEYRGRTKTTVNERVSEIERENMVQLREFQRKTFNGEFFYSYVNVFALSTT